MNFHRLISQISRRQVLNGVKYHLRDDGRLSNVRKLPIYTLVKIKRPTIIITIDSIIVVFIFFNIRVWHDEIWMKIIFQFFVSFRVCAREIFARFLWLIESFNRKILLAPSFTQSYNLSLFDRTTFRNIKIVVCVDLSSERHCFDARHLFWHRK